MGGVDARRPAAASVDVARSGEAQGFILYLIKAGLLPVRFRPPIGRAEGLWPEEGEARGLPGAAVLGHSAGSGLRRCRARERGRPRRFRVRQAPE